MMEDNHVSKTSPDMGSRSFYCTVCPVGCRLSVRKTEGDEIDVSGNECPRGIDYAEREVRNPERILTTTVRTESSNSLVPVRSDKPVPLKLLRECVLEANSVRARIPVHIGDVIVGNIHGTGVSLVASADLLRED